jgi:MFS family permease
VRGITRNVVLLGVVSLLTDISSEMVYPLIPLFLTTTLGASVGTAAFIEGCAEMTASLLKGLSGAWSDRIGKRRPFVFAGYGISALAKLGLAAATGWSAVLGARIADRFGKGLRSSARDAMLAESSAAEWRGRAFGLHRGMDQMGAVIGPLLALPLLALFNQDLRKVFMLAAIPGLLSLAVIRFTRETGAVVRSNSAHGEALPRRFRIYLLISVLFALGNSADALLLLRAKSLGASTSAIVVYFALFNLVTVLASYPSGLISDRLGRRRVLVAGWTVFAGVYAAFGVVTHLAFVPLLFAVYGLYSGIAEGAARAYVVDLVGPDKKATALGYHALATGVAVLGANVAAGLLWERAGAAYPFLYGGAMALVASLLLAATQTQRPNSAHVFSGP